MTHTGTVTRLHSQGLYVMIPDLRAEYGPLSYLGQESDYAEGVRVIVVRVGPDEYVVLGATHP